MPIFEVDGQQFEVEDKYVSDFAKEYPNAVTKVDSEEAIYEVSASDYPAYLDTQRAPRRVVPEKTTIPGSHAKPYQITPEEIGFENVLDKDNFQERYGVSPSVMERQTDPIKESVQRLRAKVGSRSNIPQYPIGNRYTFGFGSDYANKEADKIAETQLSAATENELRGAEKAQSKDGFWKSFGKGLKNEGMWTQGLTELDNNLTLAYIAKKAEKDGFDNLPEKEQDLLTASALRIASEAAYSDEKTALQIAGMSTAESIPYMLQFMLTSSPASLVTSPVRSAIKKAAEKAIKSGISSKLIPVVKGAARTAAVGAKATAMTAIQPTMYADMVSRGTGRATLENGKYAGMEEAESAPMAAYKAFANATIENLSEHSGSMLSGATKAAGNVLKKVPALGGFISNVQKNNVLSGVNKMMKAVGFNGAPEEFFEEQVSTGLNSLLVGDSSFSDFVNWKQQLATLISVGATAGAMTTTGTIMSVPYKKEIKRKYEEATDKVYDYFTPEEFDQFSSSLSRMDIDSRPDFIAQVSDMKGFAPEQINNLTEFATRQAQFDGYAGAVSDYIEEEKVRAQEEIDRISNKNMGEIIQVNGFGENPVNIVGGFVVFDDEGFVDKKRSSQTIYYLDEDGKRKMASPDKFGELVSRKPLADAYAEALGNVENDILIQEENELSEEDTPEQAQQDAMILAENGNQVDTPDGVGTISQVEEDENTAIVTFPNGITKRYSIATLKPYVDPSIQEQLQTEAPISQTEIQTEQPNQDAQIEKAPSFPVDKDGNIDYSQIQEPEQYAQALQQEFEGDAVSVIDEQIQSAQAKLEEAGKNTDAIKKRREMKAAQMELDRLNNVKSILTPSEQIVNETIPETVENEEASPSEQSNVIDLSQLTEPERRRYVVDNSTDPIELAEIYEQSKDEVDYAQMLPWEAALVGRKVSKDSFIENSDKNNITGAMSRSWFSKDGKSLDVLAQELSEFGVPVTEQDIVNFMMSHPGNSVKKRSQLSIDADRRFKETVKALTGQDVGGVESSSGKLILAGLRAGQRSEQERQALPFSTYTIPDSVLNFFEETGINPEDFDTFEELRDAVAKEQENGTFVFPLGETDLQIINNIINHGIEQQQDYANFAARVEKAGTKRAIEQPVFETEAGNQLQPIETEGEQVDNEPTPEEIAEIEAQLEAKKRPDNIFEAISEIALEQDIRDAEKELENNTYSNEVQETKSNYRTQDGKQLNFTFAEGLQNTNETANPESGSNDVQRGEDPILGTLSRELKEGEFCKVERVFTESKSFDFTAGNYIDSVHDVAYIFKQLEDESVENSFAVLVKDGKPTIIHLGMGVYTSTQLNGTAILAASERIKPDKIFFVHNHPSGNLKASQADKNVHSQLYSLFGDKLDEGIIINLKSGKFAIFNSNYDLEQTSYTPSKSNPVKVYSFNKQVFDKDYDPSSNFMITSPSAVASFISGHRLGDRKKMNIMVINNGVVANMFTKYTAVTDENVEEVAKESVLMATNYGGIAVVVYGDIGNIGDNAVAKLKKLIGIYSGGQISLLDFVSVEGNNYKSSIEEGLMEPAQEYPANKVNEDEILFRDGLSETDQIKAEAEKNGTFLKAPNGKDSNLNEKQWLQVRTKAFKEWFGDWENDPENASKVVDENGEPRVVYHSGAQNVNEFSLDYKGEGIGRQFWGTGFYFSTSRKKAKDYAERYEKRNKKSAQIYHAYVDLKNPAYTALGKNTKNYDGAILIDKDKTKSEDYQLIVISPNQIKSATENTGEFNPNNDDIRFRDAESNRLDKEYMDAVESGDMEKAQRIVDQVAKKNGYVSESEYRLSHRAPHMQPNTTPQQRFDEGRALSIEDMANGYLNVPEEFFDARNGAQWYGYNTREGMESYRSLMRAMREIKQQIEENGKVTDMPKVTVYRAVSKEVKEGSVRNGDWVSLSESYAKSHGSSWVDGPSRVIKEEVHADQIWWDGNDINEFGVDDGKGYSYKNTKNNKKLNETITRDDEGNIIPPSKRFNSRSSDPRYRGAFYSNAENAVKSIKQDKATPEQWLKMIEKTGGLKAGEDKWMGLSEWLKNSEAKTLTKQDVLDYIRQNQIVVEEVELGEGKDTKVMTGEAMHNIDILDMSLNYINNSLVEGSEDYDKGLRSILSNANSLPGFEWIQTVDDLKKAKEMVINSPESYATVKVSDIDPIRLDYTTKGLDNKKEIVLTVPSVDQWNEGDEIHFGTVSQGREVGWVRFGETTDSEGNRVMVIDEIQSKRHQEGREKGYKNNTLNSNEQKELEELEELLQRHSKVIDARRTGIVNNAIPLTAEEAYRMTELMHRNIQNSNKVPDAPFDKNWHELVMKRALKYAAENGFDKVAWTKGEQQADRYDLSKQVEEITWNKTPTEGEEGKIYVAVHTDSGTPLKGNMTPKEIEDSLGKEIAKKIVEGGEYGKLSGEGLKVGGEGMKGFYDKMLPSFMNKYGKRWGVAVGEVTLPNVEESARTMHSVDVTEDMKASVMEGQPMFKDSTSESKEVSNVEKEATTLADSLNTPIRVVRDVNEITNEDKRKEKRMRYAKGWYDPKAGEVVIVLPNAESVGDVQATILHEVVGHKGLRGLLGDKFEEMMDKIYKHLPKKERQKVMAAAMDKYKFDYRTATEEYLAEFVEKDVMEPSLWQKIKSAIKSFFRNMGVNLEMSDPDIAYLLWKSKNRLQGGDALSKINSVAKDLEAKERFREAPYTDADVLSDQLDDASKRAWESLSRDQRTVHEMVNETAELRKGVLKYFPTKEGVKKSIYELTQGLFDNAVSLKALQNLVNEVSNEPIESYANPYQFLTTIPARNEQKMKTFVKTKFSKIGQAIKEMGVPQSTVQVYAYLKHGIERNRYMRGGDIEDKTRKLQEEAEKRIDPIRDSIEYLSQQLETSDEKNTQRILAKIEGYNQAILDIQSETQVKASEYAQRVEDKDYSGVFQVADLFIQEMEDRKMTVAQIESAIEQFEKEHDTTNFWEAVNGATKWTVQNEFEMGRISKEVRDKIFSMYEYYIPLKGWEEENANEVWDYMSGQGIPVSPIKKAGGRKSLAQNPFENIGLAAQTSVMGGHKNLLKLHALRMVRNYPNKLYRVSEVWVVDEGDNWVMKAPEYSDNAETYAENVTKFEEEMNELKEQGLAKKVIGKLDVGKPITKYEAKEHEVLVYENGKPYIIYINDNPDIARAVNMTSSKPYEVGGNDPSGKDWMKRGLNGAMNLMRFTGQNLTSRNPAFVAANLVMDTQWAIAAASAKEGSAYAKKLVGNYMSSSVHASILRGVRGKLDESNPMDKMFADFQRAGGETGYSDLFKLEDFQKMLKEGLNDGTDWRKIYTWYTGSIDMLNRWAELASRFSTFVTSRNAGRDIERSAYDAKEITLNFNRKGTGAFLGNWLKFAYLFAGAGLQGAYSMANLALSKRSQKRITMVFAGTAMLGLIIPLINDMFLGGDDDELYSKKPDYERKSNFLIRIPGSDSFFKFPIAQSLRPFYNIGETLYQMVKGNRNAGEGTMDIIGGFGMLLPFDPFGGSSLMPSAFQPIYQVKENKDFFGQKIYKDDSFTQYDPEFKRAFSNTSPAFVELTRALNDISGGDEVTKGKVNVNPAILEHLVEGYLGGAFKFVNDIGKQVNGAIEVSKGNEYPYDSRSYPIVGRFYTNTAATSDINAEYYKVINDSEELNHRVRKYQELGKKGDSEAFEKSLELMNSPEYKKAIFVKAFKKRIDDLKKMAKDGNMEKNPVLKGQERELKIIMLNEIEKLDEK